MGNVATLTILIIGNLRLCQFGYHSIPWAVIVAMIMIRNTVLCVQGALAVFVVIIVPTHLGLWMRTPRQRSIKI